MYPVPNLRGLRSEACGINPYGLWRRFKLGEYGASLDVMTSSGWRMPWDDRADEILKGTQAR
jgi:hypothetical protein